MVDLSAIQPLLMLSVPFVLFPALISQNVPCKMFLAKAKGVPTRAIVIITGYGYSQMSASLDS